MKAQQQLTRKAVGLLIQYKIKCFIIMVSDLHSLSISFAVYTFSSPFLPSILVSSFTWCSPRGKSANDLHSLSSLKTRMGFMQT